MNKANGEKSMDVFSFNVQKELCASCSLALRRFLDKMEGIDSIEVADGKIKILFNKEKILETDLVKITRDSMEKLGYKILD